MSVVAAALPGGDVVSMLIILAALILLYEASIYVCVFVERRRADLLADEPSLAVAADDAPTDVDASGGGTA